MLYVKQKHAFWGDIQDDKSLRSALKTLGIDARRMSRFSQLALLGALPLREQITPDTPIFLGSPFASPSKFNNMFTQLTEQDLPSPLDFMANLNNAATFLLAQQFQTTAPSIFVAVDSHSFWQPLQLARLALKQHSQALVGWAFEHSAERQSEGSVWWLVSHNGDIPLSITELNQKIGNIDRTFPQILENLVKIV
ncbi:beta-ketoacyl synthase chain length factor [Mannheimia haemolytica]|nr:beta-ketoacyl synthase chain length factor [Mannheimia haemolytica]